MTGLHSPHPTNENEPSQRGRGGNIDNLQPFAWGTTSQRCTHRLPASQQPFHQLEPCRTRTPHYRHCHPSISLPPKPLWPTCQPVPWANRLPATLGKLSLETKLWQTLPSAHMDKRSIPISRFFGNFFFETSSASAELAESKVRRIWRWRDDMPRKKIYRKFAVHLPISTRSSGDRRWSRLTPTTPSSFISHTHREAMLHKPPVTIGSKMNEGRGVLIDPP